MIGCRRKMRVVPAFIAGALAASVMAVPGCAPAATATGTECMTVARQMMAVEVAVAPGASLAQVRDSILHDVFGPDGYRTRTDETACAGPVLHDTFSSVPVFSMVLSEAEAQRLREHPDVASVTADTLSAPTGDTTSGANPQ